MQISKRRLPFLSWPRLTPTLLRSEAFAGLSVGLMVIPQGVAYAALAGMPLITGIYASLLPALVAVLFSASQRLSVGPTALTAILVSASLGGMATPGSTEWVNLTVWLSLMTGLLQVVLGFARFGWLLNLVSSPVLLAFTQGAAVLIISSQIPAMLGFTQGWSGLLTGAGIDWASMVFGLVTLVLLLLARRWRPTVPTVLVVVLGAAGASWALGLEASGTAVVGALPQGLPALFVPSLIEWDVFRQLVQWNDSQLTAGVYTRSRSLAARSYESLTPTVCSIIQKKGEPHAHYLMPGKCTIRMSIAADETYVATPWITSSFTVRL